MQINVEIKDDELQNLLTRLQSKMKNLTPVMRKIAGIMQDSVEENFAREGRPVPWKPSARALREGGKTLQDTGRLAASITSRSTAHQAIVGTNVVYAAIHQFGGKTAPHIIKPLHKKALYWKGALHPVKSVNHPGSTIPARPFLMVQDEDWAEIKQAMSEYLFRV